MLKAVFRQNELIPLPDKIILDSPTSYPDLAHLKQAEEVEQDADDVEVYTGPTADDLRREAEIFKSRWEEEKERMFSDARARAEGIIQDAQDTAQREIQSRTDEALLIKQKAEEEAKKIIESAKKKSLEIEAEVKKTLDGEVKAEREKGREEGKESGFAEGKAEVERLISRTQVMLERAQEKRGEILKETEKEIVDLVLLISRKVIKVISENQKNIIISNVAEAMRKVRAKGDVIIRVNLADLKLATEHKQEFTSLAEGVKSIHVVEDSSVDRGGCIIETDFGEIDARISSQIAELESRILEISPIRSSIKENLPPPVVRTANLNAELAAASSMIEASDLAEEQDISPAANAALTASAALAALATMSTKGRRETDKKMIVT
jgi:flagellar assembly protein FliH